MKHLFLGCRKGVGKQIVQPPFFNLNEAEKQKLRRTRSVKQGIVNIRDMVVRGLKQEIQRDFKRFKRNHAADSDLISYIKKLESQVTQVMS